MRIKGATCKKHARIRLHVSLYVRRCVCVLECVWLLLSFYQKVNAYSGFDAIILRKENSWYSTGALALVF